MVPQLRIQKQNCTSLSQEILNKGCKSSQRAESFLVSCTFRAACFEKHIYFFDGLVPKFSNIVRKYNKLYVTSPFLSAYFLYLFAIKFNVSILKTDKTKVIHDNREGKTFEVHSTAV